MATSDRLGCLLTSFASCQGTWLCPAKSRAEGSSFLRWEGSEPCRRPASWPPVPPPCCDGSKTRSPSSSGTLGRRADGERVGALTLYLLPFILRTDDVEWLREAPASVFPWSPFRFVVRMRGA